MIMRKKFFQRNFMSELTIVIPAKNEAKLIPRLLNSLTNQDYSKMPNTRVLVADANSTDGTPEIALSFRPRLNVGVIPGGMPPLGAIAVRHWLKLPTYFFWTRTSVRLLSFADPRAYWNWPSESICTA